MPGSSNDPFGDVINLLAAPLASGLRAADQLRHGVDEMIRAVENMNRTMENLNEAAARVNALLEDVEEPVRAMIPQLTRTIETADAITRVLDPHKVGEVFTNLGDLVTRLAPLAALADNAGGLLGLAGALRLPGLGAKPANPIPPPQPRPAESSPDADGARTQGDRPSGRAKSASTKRAAAGSKSAPATPAKKRAGGPKG